MTNSSASSTRVFPSPACAKTTWGACTRRPTLPRTSGKLPANPAAEPRLQLNRTSSDQCLQDQRRGCMYKCIPGSSDQAIERLESLLNTNSTLWKPRLNQQARRKLQRSYSMQSARHVLRETKCELKMCVLLSLSDLLCVCPCVCSKYAQDVYHVFQHALTVRYICAHFPAILSRLLQSSPAVAACAGVCPAVLPML